ncbi:MAG: CPBP family intramembrane glutamic endopeptidase, partial [Steroidobacteraceae bacterium]
MMEASQGLRPGLLAIEVALITGVFWADEAGWVPLSKTPFLFLVAWGSLRLRGLGWRDVGLRLPEGWPRLAVIGVATGIAMWLLEFFVTMPVLHRALGYWPDLTDFNDIVGNAKLLAVFLALNWVLAAFGEEMVWRGYALSRVAQFCGSGTRAWVLALVVVNVAFGLAHLYQGPSGVIQATVGGVLLGVLYVATGRNLIAPILAHGIGNSIDFIVMYLG